MNSGTVERNTRVSMGLYTAISAMEASSWAHGGEGRDAVLHDELAHLPDAGEAALDVAGAPGVEVAHRQAEEPPGEEVERRGVDAHGGEATAGSAAPRWRPG